MLCLSMLTLLTIICYSAQPITTLSSDVDPHLERLIMNSTSPWNWGLYAVSVIITMLYLVIPEHDEHRPYVPKRQRWNYCWRLYMYGQKRLERFGSWIEESTTRTNIQRTHLTRVSTIRKRLRTCHPHTFHRPRRTLVIMTALAFSAQSKPLPQQERSVTFDTDSAPIGVDNRCSGCITHMIGDFEGPVRDCNRAIKGFGGQRITKVQMGTIVWKWEDDGGSIHTFRIPNSYYVPDGKVRLLSPQHWAQTQRDQQPLPGTGETTDHSTIQLFWKQRRFTKTIPLGRHDNVATFQLAPGYKSFDAFCCEAAMEPSTDDDPVANATLISDDEDATAQLESTEAPSRSSTWRNWWRNPLPDSPPPDPQQPIGTPAPTDFNLDGPSTPSEGEPATNVNLIIDEDEELKQPMNDMAELLLLHHQFGHISFHKLQTMAKQAVFPRRLATCPIPACSACLYAKATKRKWRDKTKKSGSEVVKPTKPGQVVSVDQLVSPTPGLIAQMTGFLTKKRYKYATVYVDQYSKLSYVYLQKTASAEETLEGKQAFERFAEGHGITVRNYHADNGIFKAHKWVQGCADKGQGLTFAAVNAHHMNGIAERRIRELQDMARSQLIHAHKRWPKAITANLWPYAIRFASNAINNTASFQDKSRRSPLEMFSGSKISTNQKHWKPFGCPVYVLENDLQTNSPFHKWKERATIGIYIGQSPKHNKNVALVLSLKTALVSPQFHVKFDPSFQTVKQTTIASKWQQKAGFVTVKDLNDEAATLKAQARGSSQQEGAMISGQKRKRRDEVDTQLQVGNPDSRSQNGSEPQAAAPAGDDDHPDQVPTPSVRTRSGRTSKPAQRLIEAMLAEVKQNTQNDIQGEIFCLQAMFGDEPSDNANPLLAYKATSDPDSMYYHEAMRKTDRDEFQSAMAKETKDQFENGNFSIIHKSKVPKGQVVLPAVWQMRRKRDIRTGKIKKYKARLNIDGSRMQKGLHYDQTYSPVASWNSVRMLLTMTAVHGWHTKQIDFVQAFAQAPVEKTLYMKIPSGMELNEGNSSDYVLQIHRNIYGQKQAGRVWNTFLVDKLINVLKFKQSKVDECVFYRGKTVYVLYTDDSLIAGPDKAEIDRVVEDLKKAKLDITVEGDLQDFLGVNIDRKPDGTIHLTQPHLIDQIITDLRLNDDNVKTKSTPTSSSKLLTRHSDSPSFDNSFHYRSVIGKLNYLEKASRPDISYATHQCARFAADPKVEHGEAVRWLVRYLKGTCDKGMIYRPQKGRNLELYVDADFSGNWDPTEAATDRDTARSRHGYIINYAGCPILWKSQLQGEIALSSTESEYTGISYALRDGIPIIELLKEFQAYGFPVDTAQAQVHCEVFEDNSGALETAKVHKYRPRTKHINVKLHHFRDYVARKEVTIHKICTTVQPADMLTKGLNEELLCRHRLFVQGW